jgi:large subunit ribosomal protein L35Ae
MSESDKVSGTIIGYARGPNTQYNQLVLVRLDISSDEVSRYIGRRIVVVDRYGNKYIGKILRRHSRRHPVVEARFKPNIPGQLIGSTCFIE